MYFVQTWTNIWKTNEDFTIKNSFSHSIKVLGSSFFYETFNKEIFCRGKELVHVCLFLRDLAVRMAKIFSDSWRETEIWHDVFISWTLTFNMTCKYLLNGFLSADKFWFFSNLLIEEISSFEIG